MEKLSKFNKGGLGIFLGLLCWSIIEVLGVLVYREGASPLTLLNIRAWIASILFFLTICVLRKKLFRVEIKDIGRLFLHSFLFASHLYVLWEGIKVIIHIPTVVMIVITYPIWIIILSVLFLKEKISKNKIISLALGMIGALFVIGFLPAFSFVKVNLIGAGLILLATLFWASYIILGGSLVKKYNIFTILFYNFAFCSVVFALLQNPVITIGQLTKEITIYLVLIGVVSTYLAYLFYYIGLKHIKASDAGIIGYLKPVLTLILAFLILSQVLSLFQGIGAGLIILGVYRLYKEKKKFENERKI